jgi:putative NADPH-quinone reductase
MATNPVGTWGEEWETAEPHAQLLMAAVVQVFYYAGFESLPLHCVKDAANAANQGRKRSLSLIHGLSSSHQP